MTSRILGLRYLAVGVTVLSFSCQANGQGIPPPPPVSPRPPVVAGPAPILAPPGLVLKPEWVRQPTADDIARFYPDRAAELDAAGEVEMRCLEKANGTLEACEIISETPVEMGFGEAALKLSRLFKMRQPIYNGVPVYGAYVDLSLTFTPPAKSHGEGPSSGRVPPIETRDPPTPTAGP